MHNLKIFVLALLLIATPVVQSGESTSPHIKTVERFIAAFNAQDSKAMAILVVDNIVWLSIDGEQILTETKGKRELIKGMDSYFKFCPTCRSTLSNLASTSNRISAIETASWQGENGSKSQRSISVYEFSNGLISRVYYFPAEM